MTIQELADLLNSQNGVCPPPEQQTPEQKAVLARAAVLTFVSLANSAFDSVSRTIAFATPKGRTPCTLAEMGIELQRQADELAADMRRVFAPKTETASVNPRGYSAEQIAALKRVITLGPSLEDAGDPESRRVAARLLQKLKQVNDRLGRHIGQGYDAQVMADVRADAELLIHDLERLF